MGINKQQPGQGQDNRNQNQNKNPQDKQNQQGNLGQQRPGQRETGRENTKPMGGKQEPWKKTDK